MVSAKLKLPTFYFNVRDIQEQSSTGAVAVVRRFFSKKSVRSSPQYQQENTCVESLYRSATLSKRDSSTGVFL